MTGVYRAVLRGSGTVSAMAAAAWAVAAGMSLSDGPGGIEVPRWTSTAGVMVIVCGTIISGSAWIVERGNRIAAEKHVRPLVRQELDRALAEMMPLFVATVVEAVERRAVAVGEAFSERIDGQVRDIATMTAKHTVARIREAGIDDLTEICSDLHRKAVVAGMALQAAAAGEAIGKSALRSVKTHVSTSRGE